MQQYKVDILEQIISILEDIKDVLHKLEIKNPYILQDISILIGKHDYLTREPGLQQILEELYENDDVDNDISSEKYCEIINNYNYILEDNFGDCNDE